MSTENQPPVSHSPSTKLRMDVADALTGSGSKVRGLVVDKLVQDEISKRQAAVLNVLDKLDVKHKELKKAEKEGEVKFDHDGKPVGEPSFTKPQVETMKQLRESMEKMQKALEKAFDSGDFQELMKLAG